MKYSIKVYILLITGLILFLIPLVILTILYLTDTLPKGLGALAAVVLLGISWTAALFLSADALMRMIGENFSKNQ